VFRIASMSEPVPACPAPAATAVWGIGTVGAKDAFVDELRDAACPRMLESDATGRSGWGCIV